MQLTQQLMTQQLMTQLLMTHLLWLQAMEQLKMEPTVWGLV